MKRSILIFLTLNLIVQLNCLGQTLDSTKVSLTEIKNANATFEKLKDCEIKVLELDSQITRLETIIDVKDTKITDLYNIQSLQKDNFNTLSDSNDILIGENKQLQRSLKREKLKLIVVVTGAVLLEILTIKLMYNGK